jgi:nondiscriminating glutamyl-tRNA synthetase
VSKIKVRFAPSPTGPLHIGGARSALFNYLYALSVEGDLVLRMEDTDLDRSKAEYEQEIIESLHWLGIEWNEGIEVGGPQEPYRQTERKSIYQEYAQQLLDSGQAYYCFCTEEELEQERQELIARGETPRYLGRCRHLSPDQREEKMAQGIKPTIRFEVPAHKIYLVDDIVRGRVSFDSSIIGDFIIIKSDGLPTYNFAVVIDDVLMGITHVIRAEEHLSNTPRQLMIYDALNFKTPAFAHISLILGSDRQKMSKRHGATSLIQYREMGYLPEAMFNFLALMGWSPEGEEQLLSPSEIARAFSLDRLAKSSNYRAPQTYYC